MNVLAAEMADPVCPSSKQKDLTRLFTEPGSTCNKWNLTFFPPRSVWIFRTWQKLPHVMDRTRVSSSEVVLSNDQKKIHHFEWLSRTTQRGLVVCFLDMIFFQGVFPAETNTRKPASCLYKNAIKQGEMP